MGRWGLHPRRIHHLIKIPGSQFPSHHDLVESTRSGIPHTGLSLRVITPRVRQHSSQFCRLQADRAEATCRNDAVRRLRYQITPSPPFGDVQIKFNNPFLGKVVFEPPGQDGLLELPDGISRRRQKRFFGELLADGAAARLELPFLEVFFEGFLHRLKVKTIMDQNLSSSAIRTALMT